MGDIIDFYFIRVYFIIFNISAGIKLYAAPSDLKNKKAFADNFGNNKILNK